MSERKSKRVPPLVGKWFHSFKNSEVCWQGQILQKVSDELYLIQLYEWFMGERSKQRLVALSEIANWQLYDTNEEMLFEYEHRIQWKQKSLRPAETALVGGGVRQPVGTSPIESPPQSELSK